MGKNAYTQLVDDLIDGTLSLILVQSAIRAYIRQSDYVPKEAKSILAGSGPDNAGLISKQFKLITETIGCMELLALRIKQDRWEDG